ncbi:Conserved putative membrane protein [Criblamydia sequanensis CRIB-18]|uniref:Probable queuosine precursor transporter n=2 Tax=Candidatus Criblamydia sequanensis TaxID=340071 RepID=A0A090D0V0_9BACT|nr:Conserved putative membrane protein [Criblamydia sequanensis CRIB-18]
MDFSKNIYRIISTTFSVIVVVSNIISAKLFALPLFSNFSIPAGLLTYPLTFLLSDLTTEIFGAKKSREMVYMAFGMTLLSFAIIQLALYMPSNDPLNAQAFKEVFGLNGMIVFSSLAAYAAAQLLDIKLYSYIRFLTGPRFLWVRNNGSTLLSQIADTFIVNSIHLTIGLGMDPSSVLWIMAISYFYKAFVSIAVTPLFYLLLYLIQKNMNFHEKRFESAAKKLLKI